MQISYGTQWNVVRQGCASCIKINFTDGQVLFLGIYSSFHFLKLTKFCPGFVNISNGVGVMQKFESFLLWNGTTFCSLHFVLQGYVINQWFPYVFRIVYQKRQLVTTFGCELRSCFQPYRLVCTTRLCHLGFKHNPLHNWYHNCVSFWDLWCWLCSILWMSGGVGQGVQLFLRPSVLALFNIVNEWRFRWRCSVVQGWRWKCWRCWTISEEPLFPSGKHVGYVNI